MSACKSLSSSHPNDCGDATSTKSTTTSSTANANPIHRAAETIGDKKDSDPQNPSILSSAGAIGKQFNADGSLGSIPQAVGGPFNKEGVVGSQFNAEKGGIAGTVEKLVDGPSQKGHNAPKK